MSAFARAYLCVSLSVLLMISSGAAAQDRHEGVSGYSWQNTQTGIYPYGLGGVVTNETTMGLSGEDGTLGNRAALQQACALLQQQGNERLQTVLDERFNDRSLLSSLQDTKLGRSIGGHISSLANPCMMMSGKDADLNLYNQLQQMGIDRGTEELSRQFAALTGASIEVKGGLFGKGASGFEILAVQPLWSDESGLNHVFTQLSWNRTIERDGYADGDTLNVGFAWRQLSKDRTYVYGINSFIDHNRTMNHNRMSIGADLQTATLGVSANKYFPLSDWKSIDDYTEERASSGFDVELQGRLPEYPSWQMNLKGYRWSSNKDMEAVNTWGYDTTLQWQPVNALIWEAGVNNEQDASPEAHTQLRVVYRFGQRLEDMLDRPVTTADMAGRVFDKVRRENAMRVERRTKESVYVTVIQTVGANTAQLTTGTVSLSVGDKLARPFTLTTDANVGSVARLTFPEGAILTVGAGSQVYVEADQITLISGLFQYVSGVTNVIINVPGGIVTLLGTDVDVSTSGGTSTLRVREGSAILTGAISGSATLNPSQAAASVNGVVGAALAETDPIYTSHTAEVSQKIDWVASQQAGGKVAPYPHQAPEIIQNGTTVGDTIKIAVSYNESVTVTGNPILNLSINGNPRTAVYSAADSTSIQPVFTYTLVAGDVGANTLTTHSIDLNGGTIQSGSKVAVTTMADAILAFSATIGAGQDDTPDSYSFTALTGQTLNTQVTSNIVTLTGIGPNPTNVNVTGAGSPEVSIAGGAWVTSGTISNGETLQLRLTTANAVSTQTSATVTVGTGGTATAQWDVTTIGQDDTPAAYSFTALTNQLLNTQVTSDIVAISGIGPNPTAVSISGAGAQFRICTNGTSLATCNASIISNWGSANQTIENGQYLQLRLTTANTLSTQTSATVTVGTGGTAAAQWDVTTAAVDPCTTGAVGTVCMDGAIYAGTRADSTRIYAAPSDQAGSPLWSTEYVVTGATSTSDGKANSNNVYISGRGAAVYPAIFACKNKSPAGTWYLPAREELNLVYTNVATPSPLTFRNGWYYYSSTERNAAAVWSQNLRGASPGAQIFDLKDYNTDYAVRCVRD